MGEFHRERCKTEVTNTTATLHDEIVEKANSETQVLV